MSIGSPSTWPPARDTRAIAAAMSSTPITTDGYCAGQSALYGYRPPLMAPAGAPGLASAAAVVTSDVVAHRPAPSICVCQPKAAA